MSGMSTPWFLTPALLFRPQFPLTSLSLFGLALSRFWIIVEQEYNFFKPFRDLFEEQSPNAPIAHL